ncbi:MAG: ABC transporter ATP-binding protein [Anaerolineae bacterium]|jgi:NitT/TauT family transport system ATP-binding protein|nr:ABC transporter ATP-binding protein [Anaerolineae bacterium]MDH7474497.1 ABC transporter ATP-binding protein [Anaerolineae bacterium]
MEIILRAEHISVIFPSPQGGLSALEDFSLAVSAGEFVCVVGPSGCGKSTLLRVLGGLLPPTSGQVYLHGKALNGPCSDIGIVFQKANLMPWRTVVQNIILPLEIQGLDATESRRRAAELIRLVGLEGFEQSYTRELSGGMAQRVAIARALIHDPQILLLDEPFGALDALTRERMNLELLRIWEARRQTVVMVTHNIQEAVFLSDRVIVMTTRPGRVTAEVPVRLPRPRSSDIVYSDAFSALAWTVHEAIPG